MRQEAASLGSCDINDNLILPIVFTKNIRDWMAFDRFKIVT